MSDTVISIRLTVVSVFLLATTIAAALALSLQYYFGRDLASEAASDLYTGASESVAAKWQHISEQNANIIALLAENRELVDGRISGGQLRSIAALMERNPLFYGIYLGHEDGSFHELINLNTDETARRTLNAVPDDRWLIIDVEGSGENRTRSYRYFDADFELRVVNTEPSTFDPRERPWYTEALAGKGPYRSNPYLFAQLNKPGRTVSVPIGGSRTVLGLDMTLETLSDFLGKQSVAENGTLFVFNADGNVLASSEESQQSNRRLPPINFSLTKEESEYIRTLDTLVVSNELDWPPFDYALRGQPQGYSVDVVRLLAEALELDIRFANGLSWAELTQQFRDGEIDILQSVLLTEDNRDWGLPSRAFVELPFAVATRRGEPNISAMTELAGKRLAIPKGWSIIPVVKKAFPAIQVVEPPTTLAAMKAVLAGEVDAALDNAAILNYVAQHYYIEGLQLSENLDFGVAEVPDSLHILVQKDKQPLLDILERAIASIGPEQREALRDYWLSPASGKTLADPAVVPDTLFLDASADTSQQQRLLSLEIGGEPHFAYVSPLTPDQASTLYLGLLVPSDAVVGPFMERSSCP